METTILDKQPVRILFLASDPSDSSKIRLGKELQEIRNILENNDNFEIKDHQAVRPNDVLQTIIDYKPQVVHFAGHGLDTGELCFEDEYGHTKPIPADALASLFSLVTEYVKCVIVNTCYSEIQARAIMQFIPAVIGTKKEIGDSAAIGFSSGFYTALEPDLSQNSIKKAFQLGCVSIQFSGSLVEHLTPILLFGAPELRFSSEVDSAFSGVSKTNAIEVKILIMGLTIKGKKMGLEPEIVNSIIDDKIRKLENYNNAVSKYEDMLVKVVRDELPLSEETKTALLYLQNELELRNEDVVAIQNKILLDPKLESAYSWFDRGKVHFDLRNYNKAIEYYTKAIEKRPEYSAAYYERGYTYQSLEQHANAINDYTSAIDINKNWELTNNLTSAYFARGYAYFNLPATDPKIKNENMLMAIKDWTKAIEMSPDANSYYNRGLAYEHFEQYKEAISDFEKAVELGKNSIILSNNDKARVCARIATCYNALGNETLSNEWSRKGIELLNVNVVSSDKPPLS